MASTREKSAVEELTLLLPGGSAAVALPGTAVTDFELGGAGGGRGSAAATVV